VESHLQLPDLPGNAALLDFLREQASAPDGPDDYALGYWQLHAHPDLMARLRELAPGWPLTAAYGVPMLAGEGTAAVVGLGTDWLAVRSGDLPPDVEADVPDAAWSFVGDDWHVIRAWQGQLPTAEGTRVLRELVSAALAGAVSLAAFTIYFDGRIPTP
jgi:hypothetical protein